MSKETVTKNPNKVAAGKKGREKYIKRLLDEKDKLNTQVPDATNQVLDATNEVPNGTKAGTSQVPNGTSQVPDGSSQVPDGTSLSTEMGFLLLFTAIAGYFIFGQQNKPSVVTVKKHDVDLSNF